MNDAVVFQAEPEGDAEEGGVTVALPAIVAVDGRGGVSVGGREAERHAMRNTPAVMESATAANGALIMRPPPVDNVVPGDRPVEAEPSRRS